MMSWNTKVRCVKEYNPGSGATKGKTYEIKDGHITYDNGMKSAREYSMITQLNHYNSAKFEELR